MSDNAARIIASAIHWLAYAVLLNGCFALAGGG